VAENNNRTDVLPVGAGIMSATLGAPLRLVEPDWSITLVERLAAAAESSDPWNNAEPRLFEQVWAHGTTVPGLDRNVGSGVG
jgi:hypothetical protein